MRNSDPDAAVYWLARMLEAGEDPLYIARRLVRFASEDVGNADPQALTVAVAAKEAVHFIGMPEGNTALAQAAIYLATAPKSNAVYEAYNRAAERRPDGYRAAGAAPPAKCADEADEGARYGKGYRYAHERSRGRRRHDVPAAGPRRTPVLPADRARLRKRDQTAARRLGRDQEAAIHALTFEPRNVSGTPPSSSTRSWNALMSNFGPSFCCASSRSRRISIMPIMYDVAWPGQMM